MQSPFRVPRAGHVGAARPFLRAGFLSACTILLLAAVVPAQAAEPVMAGVLDPIGPVGAAQKTILIDSLAIMLAIIVPTMVATVAFVIWFRPGNGKARRLPTWAYSGRVELVTWSIPLMVIIFLGGIAWVGSHDLDPAVPMAGGKKPLEVQVVSLDWKWLFIYPDQHVASINALTVPAGTPVRFTLTSASVWNSFFVPGLGSMIYAMNGMTTVLNLQADRVGLYRGLATHLSGDGFADMQFTLDAVDPGTFETWVGKARADGPVLDEAAYKTLSQQSSNVPPMTYRDVSEGLFDRVVSLALPPGPGPRGGPAPDVSPKGGS